MDLRPPDEVDLFVARLGLHVADRPMAVIDEWSAEFERLRADGRDGDCARLLATAKGWTLPDAHIGIIAFSEGWLLARRRHSRRALRAFERALRAFAQAGVDAVKPMVLLAMAAELEVLGERQRVRAVLTEAEHLADEAGDRVGAARIALDGVTLRLAEGHLDDDELLALEQRLGAAATTFSQAGDAVNEARTKVALGYVLERSRRAGDAQREFVTAAKLAADAEDLLTHYHAIGALGTLAMGAGQLDDADGLLNAALEGLLVLGDLSSIGRTHASLGALADLRGDADAAARHRTEALSTYEALEDDDSARRMRSLLNSCDSEPPGQPSAN